MDDKAPKNEKEQKKAGREDRKKGSPPGADDTGRKEEDIREETRKE